MTYQDFAAGQQIAPNILQEKSHVNQNIVDNGVKCLGPETENSAKGQVGLKGVAHHGKQLTEQASPPRGGAPLQVEIAPTDNFDMEALYLEASEIAGQRLTANQQLVMAMANQMVYDDLHPVTKAKVDQVINASSSGLDIQRIAAKLLNQYRQQIRTAQQNYSDDLASLKNGIAEIAIPYQLKLHGKHLTNIQTLIVNQVKSEIDYLPEMSDLF